MFASQLLRILQSITSDVKNETCVYDPAEQDMTMKENQSATLYHQSLRREADPLAFGSENICQLHGPRRDTDPLIFEVKGGDQCWNPFVDDFSMDNENETRDSPGKEDKNGLSFYPSSLEQDLESLSSDTNAKDKVQSSPEHEFSMTVEGFTHCNENIFRDSRNPFIAASDLFETDTHLYTDKNILECQPPELIVCPKEINYHIVKDICIDEGVPVKDKIVIGNSKDDHSGHSFPQPLNDDSHCEATEGGVDMELFVSDGLADSLLDNAKDVGANERREESDGKPLSQGRPKSPLESSFDEDSAKRCGQDNDSMLTGKTNFDATGKSVTYASEEGSFIDRTLPIQEFGTRSFLRSFLNSLDGEGNSVKQLPDQISSGKAACEGPASSAEAGPKEDFQASSLYYNSNVESGSITFNFNSLTPGVAGFINGTTANVKEQSVDSGDVLGHKDADTDNLSDASQVQCNSSKDNSIQNAHEQSLNINDGSSIEFSATSQSQCVNSKDTRDENVHDQSPDHNDENSDDLSCDGHVQFVSSKNRNCSSSDGQAEHRNSANDAGEASFSAAGLITYSGPIAYSGNLSLRSDGSATSGRSFAFPVLQSEWNSSPVRMAKADRRRFGKHKGWRSGLLCCRF